MVAMFTWGAISSVRPFLVYLTVKVTVTVTINGLVKLSAFNAHICPSKYLASF